MKTDVKSKYYYRVLFATGIVLMAESLRHIQLWVGLALFVVGIFAVAIGACGWE